MVEKNCVITIQGHGYKTLYEIFFHVKQSGITKWLHHQNQDPVIFDKQNILAMYATNSNKLQ